MKTTLISSSISLAGFEFAGECGRATCGSMSRASNSISEEYSASGSLLTNFEPRPKLEDSSLASSGCLATMSFMNSDVTSSGLTIPVLALISTDMLHIVNRPSMPIFLIVSPEYSATFFEQPPSFTVPKYLQDQIFCGNARTETARYFKLVGLRDKEIVDFTIC